MGVALVALPLLPIPRWVGASDSGPIWTPYVKSWLMGTLLIGTCGLLIGWLGRRNPARAVRLPLRLIPLPAVLVMAVLFASAAAVVMADVFAGNPHLVDEIAHLFQARVFTTGHLGAPAPQPPEAFLLTHTTIVHGQWVSQYPPGHTLLLAVGMIVHAEWLVNPLLAGVSVVLVFVVARGLYGPKTGLLAALLWSVSAWALFMSGTYMSHVSATAFGLAAWAAVFGPRRPTRRHWLIAGAALAGAIAIRPLDAVAAALPVLVWIGVKRRASAAVWMGVAGAPILLLLGWYNWKLFGGPFTFGYSVLYGPQHGVGFHIDPYGDPYTPLVALSNAAVAIRRLFIYLYEWPVPVLLCLALWGLFGPRRRADLYVAIGALAPPFLYFFYWHSGYFLGPRFYYGAVPFLVIGLSRSWRWIWALARRYSGPRLNLRVAATVSVAVMIVWGWADLLPTRADVYRTGLKTMKLHPKRALEDAGVEQALVLVPESWSARMIAEYWALGVSQGVMERAFRRLDTCDLYELLLAARQSDVGGEQLDGTIEKMLAAAPTAVSRVVDAPDPWIRLRSRDHLPDPCRRELARDLEGFTLFGNLGWRNAIGLGSGIVFARDLFERNDALLERYPGWDVWRWAPPSGQPDSMPVLERLTFPGSRSE